MSPTKFDLLRNEKPDYEWILKLPKTDLHCHFGGILNANGMVEVALANIKAIESYKKSHLIFSKWLVEIKQAVISHNDSLLMFYISGDKYNLRNYFPDIDKPITVAAFISCFETDIDYLERLVFGEYIEIEKYQNVGIDAYERLGDMQGSALLQSEASIRKACAFLILYCKEQNIAYLELRCSPCNYTEGGLSEKDVIRIMHDSFSKDKRTDIRLIIIGSRHGVEAIFNRHVQLILTCKNDPEFKDFIVGFDVAGNEARKSPAELRPLLLPLLKECIKFTIHAGENHSVDNIWEAVYEISADRIGHGLTLNDNPDLLKRFKDRNIFIELCPSSNYQISDFISPQGREYPLRSYFDNGLKITVNTDNMGISRTNISNEYLIASQMAKLTKLEVLQLLRNSFQGVFLSKDEKKQLLIKVEDELFKLLT